MLVLTRKENQSVRIGNDVVVKILAVKGNRITIGIEAPKEVKILRTELPPKETVAA